MEVSGRNKIIYSWLKAVFIILFILTVQAIHAQVPVRAYGLQNGKMYIALGKDLSKPALDSFIAKHELFDLDLPAFLKTGSADSLRKLGWTVDFDNKEVYWITKPLFSADNINNVADKILFMQKEQPPGHTSPTGSQSHFGYNRFKNKSPFAVNDSSVRLFLRGTVATSVMLVGSFNGWEPGALPMNKTDSGWIADVKLPPGKHWYKFLIDGDWRIDTDNLNVENDGLGNDNSVYYKNNYSFNLEGYANAKRIYVAGSFNEWREKDLLMQRTDGGWTIPVYLPEGTHTYRFIVDGNWLTDPANNDKLPNEFNEFNSVVRIGMPYLFKLDKFTDAKKVSVLGSFNNWKEDELFMNKTATGWELPYTLGPGNYEYKLKIDDKFTADAVTNGNTPLVISPNFTFRLKGFENAKTVTVAGDLNNWNPTSFRMTREGGEWVFKAHLGKGKHRYKFIVDGNWILDPANKLWEQNEHNTGNSVLWIE